MSFNSLFGLGSHSADANLEGCWPLQETTGTQADDISGNARHGTIVGMGANPVTTTGPNSWATSAFDFQGTDDVISIAAAAGVSGASPRTLGGWVYPGGQNVAQRFAEFGDGPNGSRFSPKCRDTEVLEFGGGNVVTSDNPGVPSTTWSLYTAHVVESAVDTTDIEVYLDGVILPSLSVSSTKTLSTSISSAYLGASPGSSYYFVGGLAFWFSFSRNLSTSELAQILAGPELVNTVAPTVSGDTAVGSTLTAGNGTWALPSPFASGSNGTVTYSYQWTRDGSDISGATSSTYTTQAADVGTAVGCKVLASNDGGSDAAEETSSSNTISVVSATTYRMSMTRFIPTQA